MDAADGLSDGRLNARGQAQPFLELSLPKEAGQGGEEDEQVSNVWGFESRRRA